MDEKGPEEGVNPQSIEDVEKEHGKHSGVAAAAREAKESEEDPAVVSTDAVEEEDDEDPAVMSARNAEDEEAEAMVIAPAPSEAEVLSALETIVVELDTAEELRVLEFVGEDEESLGLGALLFNTFRIGKKWADVEHLELLSLVLVNGDERKDLGKAIVVASDKGALDDMLDKHVGLNHGVLSIRHASDQRTRLSMILSKVYNKRLTSNDTAVVLYLQRIAY